MLDFQDILMKTSGKLYLDEFYNFVEIAQFQGLAHCFIAQFWGLGLGPLAIDQLWQRVLHGRWYARAGKCVDAPCLASLLRFGDSYVHHVIAQFRGLAPASCHCSVSGTCARIVSLLSFRHKSCSLHHCSVSAKSQAP